MAHAQEVFFTLQLIQARYTPSPLDPKFNVALEMASR